MIRLPILLVGILVVALLVGFATPALAVDANGKIKTIAADKGQFVMVDSKDRKSVV